MCGRFTHHLPWSEIHGLHQLTLDNDRGRNTQPRYNIAPTQNVLFVHNDADGKQIVDEGRWWLVPFWAKEMPKATLFNARSETGSTTPAFRDAFKSRRCLIPADGFYEWTVNADDGKKTLGSSISREKPRSRLRASGRITKSSASPVARS